MNKEFIIKKRHKLSNQMIIAITLTLALVLIFFTVQISKNIKESEKESFNSRVKSVNSYFNLSINRLVDNVESLKINFNIAKTLYKVDSDEFIKFLSKSTNFNNNTVSGYSILDLHTKKVDTRYTLKLNLLNNNVIYNIINESNKLSANNTEFYVDKIYNKFYILSKVDNEKMIIIAINDDFFSPFFLNNTSNKSEFGIISNTGILISDINGKVGLKTIYDLDLDKKKIDKILLDVKNGKYKDDINISSLDFRKNSVGYFFMPIYLEKWNSTWLIFAKENYSELNSRSNAITKMISISGFFLFMVLAVFIRVFINKSLKPLDNISDVMEEFSKGNYNARVTAIPKNEIKTIGYNLNGLLDTMNKDRNELLVKNKEISELLSEVEELVQENNRIYYETIKTLAKTIDAKDEYTGGHCERVTKYSLLIAQKMDLSSESIKNLTYGAMLHDIGKIGISENIITKKGRLTDLEYLEIKRHPYLGYDIINDINFLSEASLIALEHHERVDGKGYPDGKSGDQIKIESKIVMVADSFDAMTTNRSYRNALKLEDAMNELINNKGSQFDSVVVDAFIELIKIGKIDLTK
ncbi:HD domain-containing phosphohydrolase [Helicovermis profundi]